MLWLKWLLKELGLEQVKFVLHSDSQNTIHVSKNPSFCSCSKHIKMRYHWVRDILEEKILSSEKV